MVSGSAAAADVNLAKVDAAVGAFAWDGRTLSQVLPVAAIERIADHAANLYFSWYS